MVILFPRWDLQCATHEGCLTASSCEVPLSLRGAARRKRALYLHC
jgi:hypothetical protein